MDFGRAEDGEHVLRYWNTETGGAHDVRVGDTHENEPCWDEVAYDAVDWESDRFLYSMYYGPTVYATEEFVLTGFYDYNNHPYNDWHVVVPWDDMAYPVIWPGQIMESGEGQLPWWDEDGIEASFVEGEMRVAAPHGEAYYRLGFAGPPAVPEIAAINGFVKPDGFSDFYEGKQQEFSESCEHVGLGSTLKVRAVRDQVLSGEGASGTGLAGADLVDYLEFVSEDHPRHEEYVRWSAFGMKAWFDGSDGYHYALTIGIPGGWEDLPPTDEWWSFVFTGDTGEVVACRRTVGSGRALLVKPEGHPDLVDRFALPAVFSAEVFTGVYPGLHSWSGDLSDFAGSSECAATGDLLGLGWDGARG